MTQTSLASCIVKSLKDHEMSADLPGALLTQDKGRVAHRDETEFWDYKQQLSLDSPIETAEVAKDILGFHNAKGGMLIIGVDKTFRLLGILENQVLDTKRLNDKIRKYVGPHIGLFQDTVQLPNGKAVWLIFIPKREDAPSPILVNGPTDNKGKPCVRKGEYYVRVNDETKLCIEPADYQRLFTNVSMDHIQAYLYDIDEPYFRLLAPHCAQFVGRRQLLMEVADALESRHPVIALDGVGGVGKTAVALELTKHLYDSKRFMFIVSLSAKSKVWHDYSGSRKAAFSGMTEFLREIAQALQLSIDPDLAVLKKAVIDNMSGLEGLLLVDNIEDIQDSAVLRFLSREVPDPVKVLVTSRVDRGLGALTISVPEMNETEARELLCNELSRLEYKRFYDEPEHIEKVLQATGHLPLALKWAAGLASSLGSLKEASSRLRKQDDTKREFLDFCFATMFDELSPLSREVALLSPYLGEEWNVAMLSVALDRPEREISNAINELKERGIVLASSSTREGALYLLPLTVDFLSNKWHENEVFRTQVMRRLADAIASSEDVEGVFLNWPREERVKVLFRRAESLIKSGDLKRAGQLVGLALNWSSDPKLQFLRGRILYESGKKSEGISYMRLAVQQAQEPDMMTEERLFLSMALLSAGSNRDETDALEHLKEALPSASNLTREHVGNFCVLALQLREFRAVRRVLEQMTNPVHIYWMVKALDPNLEDLTFVHSCGSTLSNALMIAERSAYATEDERKRFLTAARRIDGLLNGPFDAG